MIKEILNLLRKLVGLPFADPDRCPHPYHRQTDSKSSGVTTECMDCGKLWWKLW